MAPPMIVSSTDRPKSNSPSVEPTPPSSACASPPTHNHQQPCNYGYCDYSQNFFPVPYLHYGHYGPAQQYPYPYGVSQPYPYDQGQQYPYSPGQQYPHHDQQQGQQAAQLAPAGVLITDENAQELLPATARVMVGNLRPDVDAESIRTLFISIGNNFIHLSQKGKYTVAFVQFLRDEHAQEALAKHKQLVLHGRCVRIELSKDGRVKLERQKQLHSQVSTGDQEDEIDEHVDDDVLERHTVC